jgi:hypothetical protein
MGEYGWCILYASMNMKQWNLLKSPYKGDCGRKENNGENEPIHGIMHIYINIYIKHNVYKHYICI